MKNKALLCIIIAGALWGTSGIFVHYLAPYGLTSIQMTAVRGVVSLVAIGAYLFFYDRRLFKVKASHIPLFIGAGLSMFLTAACYYISMQMTSVATSVTLMYTAPIFVTIYSVAFMGEKMTKVKAMLVLAVFVGCAFVAGVVGGMKYNLAGILIGLFSGLTFSVYNIITKIEMCKKINPIASTFYCYVFMAFFGLVTSSPTSVVMVISENSLYFILILISLGVFTSAMPYFLYTYALKSLPAGLASCFGVMEPLAATIYSVLLFGEQLGIYQILGIIIIISTSIVLGKTESN